MKYVTMAKKTEYSAVCEPLYASKDMPKTEAEWNALKDSQAVNRSVADRETDLFSMARKADVDFSDLSGRIVDIAVCIPINRETGEYKLIVQKNVEVVCLVTMPGIVFKNVKTGECINVYKGVVKMFEVKE